MIKEEYVSIDFEIIKLQKSTLQTKFIEDDDDGEEDETKGWGIHGSQETEDED